MWTRFRNPFRYRYWLVECQVHLALIIRRSRFNPTRHCSSLLELIDGPFDSQEDIMHAQNFWLRQLYPATSPQQRSEPEEEL